MDHLRQRVDKDLKEYMNEFDVRTTGTLEQLKESVSLDLALEKQYLKVSHTHSHTQVFTSHTLHTHTMPHKK